MRKLGSRQLRLLTPFITGFFLIAAVASSLEVRGHYKQVKDFGRDGHVAVEEALLDKNLAMAGQGVHEVSQYLPALVNNEFVSATMISYFLIVVSEIGDKTFFIAALLAMKRGALVTFAGSGSALVAMTALSAIAGRALPNIVDPGWTHIASVALFVFFGVKLLWEAWNMDEKDCNLSTEMEEVERDLQGRDVALKRESTVEMGTLPEASLEAGASSGTERQLNWSNFGDRFKAKSLYVFRPTNLLSTAFVEAFTLTFAAEWGDRSQIATIALGASKNIYGVNLGAIMGHWTCTGLAVIGGQLLASRISARTVLLTGGVTFLIFAFMGYMLEG